MPRPKKEKLTPEQESAIVSAGIHGPQVRDIVQITAIPHQYTARIGIVHTINGDTLICYAPGKNGFPYKFNTRVSDVAVVGKARLAYTKELPEDSVYSDVERDKI